MYTFKPVRAFSFVLLAIFVSLSFCLSAQDRISFAVLNSKYRKIDKPASYVPLQYKKSMIGDRGIGNILFSYNELEIEDKDTNLVVYNKFDYKEIENGFYALAYLPGREKDLVRWVEEKNSSYKYEGFYAILKWAPLLSPDFKQSDAMYPANYYSILNDQAKISILPRADGVFPGVDLSQIKRYGKYDHTLELFFYLRFSVGTMIIETAGISSNMDLSVGEDSDSGRTVDKSIRKVGDKEVNTESLYTNYLVSYGKCAITNNTAVKTPTSAEKKKVK